MKKSGRELDNTA